MSEIGKRQDISRCPHSDSDYYVCTKCKDKKDFEMFMDCPHNTKED